MNFVLGSGARIGDRYHFLCKRKMKRALENKKTFGVKCGVEILLP